MRPESAHTADILAQCLPIVAAEGRNLDYPLHRCDGSIHVPRIENAVFPFGRKFRDFVMRAVKTPNVITTQVTGTLGAR